MGEIDRGPDDARQGAPGARHGKAAGLPFDWRRPTFARFKQTYWNTSTRKVFVPKLFGWGWDLNFGGLARRLHLVRAPADGT